MLESYSMHLESIIKYSKLYCQVPIIRRPINRQARFYCTFFKRRKYLAHSGKSVTFRTKYPTIRNVPDEFRHIRLNCPRVAAAILKAQRLPPLAAANRNIYQNKNIRFVYTCSLSCFSVSFVLLLPLALLFLPV